MASTHVQPLLGQEDMTRELSLGFDKIVKYMQVREKDRSTLRRRRDSRRRGQSLSPGQRTRARTGVWLWQ